MFVLIVEDDASILKLIEMTLKKVCNVVLAENGKIGLEKAKLLKPQLIISDNMMPEMSGIELKEHLNEFHETKDIPFIFLTALSDEKIKEKALSLGVIEYLIKPISPILIRQKVLQLLKIEI
ncbi:MAG: response regulator [Cyanobacteriota bacterium]